MGIKSSQTAKDVRVMVQVTINVPDDLKRRLDTLALEIGKSVEDSILIGLLEYVETWERHLDDVHQIDENELRAVLSGDVDD